MRRLYNLFRNLLVLGLVLTWVMPGKTPEVEAETGPSGTYWLITDIHHLSPDLYKSGDRIQVMQASAAGLDIFQSPVRLQALVYQIKEAKPRPQALIMAGDLTFNGERASLEDLVHYLHQIEDLGVPVYVIPGNHDIANGWARGFDSDSSYPVDQVTADQFSTTMSDFGYQEANLDHRDPSSLSYSCLLSPGLRLIMLDSNRYQDQANQDQPTSEGRIKEASLDWLEEELKQVHAKQEKVLLVLHHNGLNHFEAMKGDFAVDNWEDLVDLLDYYQVPVSFSGHMHAQHIGDFKSDGLQTRHYDLATGSFAVFPSSMGRIQVSESGLSYDQLLLDVDAWAHLQDHDLFNSSNYRSYMQDVFDQANRALATEAIYGDNYLDDQAPKENMVDFILRLNRDFFAGVIDQDKDSFQADYHKYKSYFKEAKAFFLTDYLEILIEEVDRNNRHIQIEWPSHS